MAEAVVLRSVKGSPLTHTEMDNNFTNPTRNLIDGLITSNDTDSDHDISVSAGIFTDSTNARVFETTSAIVKQIDANWAEGTAAGGFPSGLTLTADTTYHYFMIAKTDGTVDSGWDTSLTATNLLADATGYTLFRRIASHLIDSSSNITAFTQTGNEFVLDIMVRDVSTANPGTSAVTATLSTPVGVVVNSILGVTILDTTTDGAGVFMFASALTQPDTAATNTVQDVFVSGSGVFQADSMTKNVQTNTSAQVRYRISASNADVQARLFTKGWLDPRGKE